MRPLILALLSALGLARAHVTLVSPLGGEDVAGGSEFTIVWDADDHNCVYNLYFSPDSGKTWSAIALGIEQGVRAYKWTVPETDTPTAIVRILQDNVSGTDLDDRSPAFRIRSGSAIRVRAAGKRAARPFLSRGAVFLDQGPDRPLRLTVDGRSMILVPAQ